MEKLLGPFARPTGLAVHRRPARRFIEAEARAQLAQSGYAPLHEISCEFRQGVLTLRGRVDSFYLKQVAQSRVLHRLERMTVIENRIEVTSRRRDV